MLAPAMTLKQLLFLTVLAGIAKSRLSAESAASRNRAHVLIKLIKLDGKYVHFLIIYSG